MRLFIKKNKITILVIILLGVWFSIGISTYVKEYGYKARLEGVDYGVERCKEVDWENDSFLKAACENFFETQNNSDRIKLTDDTLTAFYIIVTSAPMFYISLIIPVLVMLCAVENFHKNLKNGYIKNKLARAKYSSVIIKSFWNSYKKIFLFMAVLLVVLFASYLISGHFVYHESVNCYEENLWIYKNFPFYLIIYFINIFLNYIFYMNIAFCMCKRNKNMFIAVILSFLIWLAIDIFTEIILTGYIFGGLFKIKLSADAFNLFAIYAWRMRDGDMLIFCCTIILTILSFVALWLTYRKKESVVIASEK